MKKNVRYMAYDGMIYILCADCYEKVYNCKCISQTPTADWIKKWPELARDE